MITLRDPYNDPELYASRIMEAWGLKRNRIIFALYIKEGDRWSALLKLSPDLQEIFNFEKLGLLKQRVEDKIKKRKIREAVVDTASSIFALVAGEDEDEKAAKVDGKGSRLVFYVLLGIAGVGLLPIIIRALLIRLCPQCGRRLRVQKSTPLAYIELKHILYYCPRCGYSKVERVGEG